MALDFAADMSAFLNTDEHAETITYTPAGGSGSSIIAVVDDQGISRDFELTGEDSLRSAFVLIQLSDVAAPAIGDSVTYDGSTWTVVAVQKDTAAAQLTIETRTDRRKYPEGHRLRQ